jgi:hypothetical protein
MAVASDVVVLLGIKIGAPASSKGTYGWMPHNASFGFLDRPPAILGQIHFLDRF